MPQGGRKEDESIIGEVTTRRRRRRSIIEEGTGDQGAEGETRTRGDGEDTTTQEVLTPYDCDTEDADQQ